MANLLDGADVAAADAAANWPARVAFTTKVFMGTGTVDTFIAQLDGVKCKGTSGKKGFYDKKFKDSNLVGLLDWFLSDDVDDNQRGLFIAMLRDNTLAADHCIGIDTKKRIILDPSREHALPLVRSSFDLCVPDGYTCSGIAAARKLLVELSDVAPPVTDANSTDAKFTDATDATDAKFTDAEYTDVAVGRGGGGGAQARTAVSSRGVDVGLATPTPTSVRRDGVRFNSTAVIPTIIPPSVHYGGRSPEPRKNTTPSLPQINGVVYSDAIANEGCFRDDAEYTVTINDVVYRLGGIALI